MEFFLNALNDRGYQLIAMAGMILIGYRSIRQELPGEYAALRVVAALLYWTVGFLASVAFTAWLETSSVFFQLTQAIVYTYAISVFARRPYVELRAMIPTKNNTHRVAAGLLATHVVFWKAFEHLPGDTKVLLTCHRTSLDLSHPYINALGDLANYKHWLLAQTRATTTYCESKKLYEAASGLDARGATLAKSIENASKKKGSKRISAATAEINAIATSAAFVAANRNQIDRIANELVKRLELDQRRLVDLLADVQLTDSLPSFVFEPHKDTTSPTPQTAA